MQIAIDAIVARLVEALEADSAFAGVEILEDTDVTDIPETTAQAVIVSWRGSYPARVALSGHPEEWQSTLRLSAWARRDQSVAGQRASRSLAGECYRLLMSLRTDAELRASGVIDVGPPQMVPDAELLGTRMGTVALDFPITHQTAAGRLTYA